MKTSESQLNEMTAEHKELKKKFDELTKENTRLREMVSATIPSKHKKNTMKIDNLFNHRSANSIDNHYNQIIVPTKVKKIKDSVATTSTQQKVLSILIVI